MKELLDLISQHQVVLGAVGALVLSAAFRAVPEPDEKSTRLYRWFHDFGHLILANFDKVGKP